MRVLDSLKESHSAEVRWVLAELDHASAAAAARAVPLDNEAEQQIPAMRESYIDAARCVQNGEADSVFALHRDMHDLMALADETHPVTIQAVGRQVITAAPLSPLAASPTVDPPQRDPVSLGTVRGRVETLSR